MSKGIETRLLKIGKLAEATRETKPTIRFWTNESLLEVAKTTKGGYALYNPKMIEKAQEIRRFKQQGRTL